MIVLDASALVELILGTAGGQVIAERIADPAEGLHVPHLADIEVAQALRRYVRDGDISAATAAAALADLRALDLQRHAHEPLLDRVWELRSNLTAYDAVYARNQTRVGVRAFQTQLPPMLNGPSLIVDLIRDAKTTTIATDMTALV